MSSDIANYVDDIRLLTNVSHTTINCDNLEGGKKKVTIYKMFGGSSIIISKLILLMSFFLSPYQSATIKNQ